MEITHLGHACLLIESGDQRILIDPGNFSELDGLRDLTAVIVTHQHADHCDLERVPGLLADNPDATVLAEPQTAEQLEEKGLGERVERLVAGQVVQLGSVEVTPVGELHAPNHPYVPRVGNVGVVLRGDGPTLYHPGDAVDGEPGEVDLLAVPINAPWSKVAETIEFVRRIAPARAIIPIHDALLSDAGRKMYLTHVGDFGADGGVEVLDLRGAGATSV
ncbi:MBL fold metallo-hydrolase [Ornithinimicrobium sp. Y1694]|uniref:MBL fold metallo-hydrolase n=1 Tax=Ornithinimicrobium sp. Y1694 TaxID=3418590 RepID=UPI003CFA3DDD